MAHTLQTGAGSAEQAPTDEARSHEDQLLAYQAAALYLATAGYNEALTMNNPAAALDNMCDAVEEIMPDVCRVVDAAREFANILRVSIKDYFWTFATIEHARIEAGEGYGYLFDLLADNVRAGGDTAVARKSALEAPGRIREIAAESAAYDRAESLG